MFKTDSIPAKILVGNNQITYEYAEKLICSTLCLNKGESCYCQTCRKIKQGQHPAVRIINPEKDYTVADIDKILEESKFSRDEGELFFFILLKAETLSTATANRLLKILEEPPTGYYYLLLTNNLESILPTIISRSQIIQLYNEDIKQPINPLLDFFCNPSNFTSPSAFEQTLAAQELTDNKSIELIYELFNWYLQEQKKLITNNTGTTSDYIFINNAIEHINKAIQMPPQSGSSAIFWKNLFLSFPKK